MLDQFFEVESILESKTEGKETFYLVKWMGYPTTEATWEPVKNLSLVKHMIKEFNDELKKKGLKETKVNEEENEAPVAVMRNEGTERKKEKSRRLVERPPEKEKLVLLREKDKEKEKEKEKLVLLKEKEILEDKEKDRDKAKEKLKEKNKEKAKDKEKEKEKERALEREREKEKAKELERENELKRQEAEEKERNKEKEKEKQKEKQKHLHQVSTSKEQKPSEIQAPKTSVIPAKSQRNVRKSTEPSRTEIEEILELPNAPASSSTTKPFSKAKSIKSNINIILPAKRDSSSVEKVKEVKEIFEVAEGKAKKLVVFVRLESGEVKEFTFDKTQKEAPNQLIDFLKRHISFVN